jgi:hypothetical protein
MEERATQYGAAAEPSISPIIDREGARARVAAHLAAHRPVEELGIERNRPQDCQDFAFVGIAPKRAVLRESTIDKSVLIKSYNCIV